jgi:Reversibly glycosylated polypeptide
MDRGSVTVDAVVVVPSARETSLLGFLDAWRHELAGATILVVEDGPERTFAAEGANVRHFARCDIEDALGDVAWVIPRGTGCIRSFGCWLAHQMRPDMIVALDDDTRPDPAQPGFLDAHWSRLQRAADPAWVSTLEAASPRGMPYFTTDREPLVVLNHGLWSGAPDFDAPTQLLSSRVEISAAWSDQTIPRGRYFPMCSMNLAWRPEFTAAMYFLLMGPAYPFDRFGDIWGGVLAKRVADHLGFAVNSGSPGVLHERASDVFANLAKESRGLAANETFWRAADSVVLTAETVPGAYAELAERLPLEQEDFVLLRRAMRTWAELFGADAPATHPVAHVDGLSNGSRRARANGRVVARAARTD